MRWSNNRRAVTRHPFRVEQRDSARAAAPVASGAHGRARRRVQARHSCGRRLTSVGTAGDEHGVGEVEKDVGEPDLHRRVASDSRASKYNVLRREGAGTPAIARPRRVGRREPKNGGRPGAGKPVPGLGAKCVPGVAARKGGVATSPADRQQTGYGPARRHPPASRPRLHVAAARQRSAVVRPKGSTWTRTACSGWSVGLTAPGGASAAIQAPARTARSARSAAALSFCGPQIARSRGGAVRPRSVLLKLSVSSPLVVGDVGARLRTAPAPACRRDQPQSPPTPGCARPTLSNSDPLSGSGHNGAWAGPAPGTGLALAAVDCRGGAKPCQSAESGLTSPGRHGRTCAHGITTGPATNRGGRDAGPLREAGRRTGRRGRGDDRLRAGRRSCLMMSAHHPVVGMGMSCCRCEHLLISNTRPGMLSRRTLTEATSTTAPSAC